MPFRNTQDKNRDENGVVAILVVTVMTIILALVSLGFAKIMDRELGQATNRELSAQAYYSALSGLNDAQTYLAAAQAQGLNGSLTGCSDWQNTALGKSYFVSDLSKSNGQSAAKYSCLSINTTPNELDYPLNAGKSVTFKLSNLPKMNTLYFGWQNQKYASGPQPMSTQSGSSCSPPLSYGTLPSESQVCGDATGVLRVTIYPVPNTMPAGVNNTNDALSYLSRTYFLYPNRGSGKVNCAPAIPSPKTDGCVDYDQILDNSVNSNGAFVSGNCAQPLWSPTLPSINPYATPNYCNSGITNFQGFQNNYGSMDAYYVRLTAEYQPLNVSIQATPSNNSSALDFTNAQNVIDVTGTGSDVLQRIRARVNATTQYQDPSYGIQSMVALCKGFEVPVMSQNDYGTGTDGDQIAAAIPNSDGACAYPIGPDSPIVRSTPLDTLPGSQRPCPNGFSGAYPTCRVPVVVNFTADSYNLPYNNSGTNLHWSTTYGATYCTGTGFSTGTGNPTSSPPGGVPTGSLSPGQHDYTINCSGSSTQLTVNVAYPPPPSLDYFNANPSSIPYGGSSNLYWSAYNATSCNYGGASGNVPTGNLTSSTTYNLYCSGPGGQNVYVGSTTVTVGPPQSCWATASHAKRTSVASATGGCNYGSWSWTYVYTLTAARCPGDDGTFNGSGNYLDFDSVGGSYSVTFYLTGSNGGSATTKTVSWSQGGSVC